MAERIVTYIPARRILWPLKNMRIHLLWREIYFLGRKIRIFFSPCRIYLRGTLLLVPAREFLLGI
jgi:hypothetical protein